MTQPDDAAPSASRSPSRSRYGTELQRPSASRFGDPLARVHPDPRDAAAADRGRRPTTCDRRSTSTCARSRRGRAAVRDPPARHRHVPAGVAGGLRRGGRGHRRLRAARDAGALRAAWRASSRSPTTRTSPSPTTCPTTCSTARSTSWRPTTCGSRSGASASTSTARTACGARSATSRSARTLPGPRSASLTTAVEASRRRRRTRDGLRGRLACRPARSRSLRPRVARRRPAQRGPGGAGRRGDHLLRLPVVLPAWSRWRSRSSATSASRLPGARRTTVTDAVEAAFPGLIGTGPARSTSTTSSTPARRAGPDRPGRSALRRPRLDRRAARRAAPRSSAPSAVGCRSSKKKPVDARGADRAGLGAAARRSRVTTLATDATQYALGARRAGRARSPPSAAQGGRGRCWRCSPTSLLIAILLSRLLRSARCRGAQVRSAALLGAVGFEVLKLFGTFLIAPHHEQPALRDVRRSSSGCWSGSTWSRLLIFCRGLGRHQAARARSCRTVLGGGGRVRRSGRAGPAPARRLGAAPAQATQQPSPDVSTGSGGAAAAAAGQQHPRAQPDDGEQQADRRRAHAAAGRARRRAGHGRAVGDDRLMPPDAWRPAGVERADRAGRVALWKPQVSRAAESSPGLRSGVHAPWRSACAARVAAPTKVPRALVVQPVLTPMAPG